MTSLRKCKGELPLAVGDGEKGGFRGKRGEYQEKLKKKRDHGIPGKTRERWSKKDSSGGTSRGSSSL